jgi:hypothetical protein
LLLCPQRQALDYPPGVAWEHFHTLDNIPVFNEPKRVAHKARPAARLMPRQFKRRLAALPILHPSPAAIHV